MSNSERERTTQELLAEIERLKLEIGKLKSSSAGQVGGQLEEQPWFNQLFDTAGVPVALNRLEDGRYLEVNDSFVTAFGYSREELLTMRGSQLLAAPLSQLSLAEQLKKTGFINGLAVNLRTKSGQIRQIDCYIKLVDWPQPNNVLSLNFDVTERQALQETLRQTEQLLRTVINTTPIGLFALDRQGVITLLEGNLAGLIKNLARQDQLVGQAAQNVFPQLSQVNEVIEQLLAGQTINETVEIEGNYIEVFGKPQYDQQGHLAGTNGVMMDITPRRLAEEELRKSEERLRLSQRMEAIGRLAGGVAHDFNNLLSAILGYANLLETGLDTDSPLLEEVQEIERAAERAAGLTRQLLAFSRRQLLQAEVLDLNEVVLDMDKLLRRLIGEDIEIKLHLSPEAEQVKADPSQLEQVLMNLVVNARDAMQEGGMLTIETSPVELDEKYAANRVGVKPGAYVLLAVSDTGHGIDPAIQPQIFEPFFTTKKVGQGSGLGLSTVYGIVKQSGGNIWVYSEPGIGTTFKVYLPRIEQTPQPTTSDLEQAETAPAPGQETILLVEDDEAVRTLAQKILSRQGYHVLAAGDGPQALNYCQPATKIDLLLTDVVMPQLNGTELTRRVKALYPATKVLYMSGYPSNAIINNGTLSPQVAFIQKPFTPGSLLRKVRQTLDQPEILNEQTEPALEEDSNP